MQRRDGDGMDGLAYAMLGGAARNLLDTPERRARRRRIIAWICSWLVVLALLAGVGIMIWQLTKTVHPPSTAAPTGAPTTAAPTTATPTGAPTTATPTGAPTTATPTTATPTGAPTTATPTLAPGPCSGTCPSFGALGNFTVLGASTVTNTGTSIVNGDLGLSPGTSVTGFNPPGVVTGTIHVNNPTAANAQASALTLRTTLQACNTTCTATNPSLSGTTLTPGSYCFSSSASITGTLTLDAQGVTNATFLFHIATALTAAGSSVVSLTNGAQPCNVFWIVGTSATFGTSSVFRGVVIADQSITYTTTASSIGRNIALNAAVTLDTNVLTVCDCV